MKSIIVILSIFLGLSLNAKNSNEITTKCSAKKTSCCKKSPRKKIKKCCKKTSCNKSKTTTLIVKEVKAPCEGNPKSTCLLIKKENAKDFEVLNQNIAGFTFEEGYRQTILVNEREVSTPNVKQTTPIYTLVNMLKKEKISDTISTAKTSLINKWYLRKMIDNESNDVVMDDNSVWIQFDGKDNKVNGKAPCNSYFGAFVSDYKSTFQTLALASTKMYCDPVMKYEDLYMDLLQKADNYSIADGKLNLYKGKQLLLIFE